MNDDPKKLLKPITLGKLTLSDRIFYAPLAGCSDYPFRQMAARYRPALMFCEMVKMEPLVRRDRNTLRLLDYSEEMRPIGAQLCGSRLEIAGDAARLIEEKGFDLVDLNCGCPVDKVTKDGSGSALLRTPKLIGQLIEAMVKAVNIPVTLKMRAGWDEENINALEIARIAYESGARTVTIHGRTRKQGYFGPARWDWIAEVKQALPQLVVVGNGDLFSPEAVRGIVEATCCDAVLIARGTLGHPWIAEEIRAYLRKETVAPRTVDEMRRALYDHFQQLVNYYEQTKALLHMRKIGCWYFKAQSGIRAFREQISKATSLQQVEELILQATFSAEEEASSKEAAYQEDCCV